MNPMRRKQLCILNKLKDSEFEENIARWYDFSLYVIPAMIWFMEELSGVEDTVLLQPPQYLPL